MQIEHVVVIGAGAAGLAAASRLRAGRVKATVIEASDQVGGRARTIRVLGHPFDLGASWLHDVEHNPLAALSVPADGLIDSDSDRSEHVSIGGRPATPKERAEYDAAWDRVDAVTAARLHAPDLSLAAAMADMRRDPWAPLVALWEGAIIAAADADRLSLRDWHRNRLNGHNAVLPEGLGAFLVRKLAGPVALHTPATRVDWSGPGVRVDTPNGVIRADAAVITVSTGVLAAGDIRFEPPLPSLARHAIEALPMGLLSKVLLPPSGPGRLGLATNTVVVDQAGRMTFNAWPQGRPHLVGFVGGVLAWQVSTDPRAAEDLARAELSRALGGAATHQVGAAVVVTDWGTNPLFRGSYAYAEPGDADQRGVLGASFPGERLIFAGEATRMDGLAGTVGGAYRSGMEAAQRLLRINAVPAAGPAGSP